MSTDLILGTAGHIDHGKTTLIRCLTGVDTDRLPEEKRRGITIELGFAELTVGPYRLGIVDVPGHERFVRQMLAGATGMDLALLVVAADDSVKPQTREHLDVLRMLRLPAGVIALTKSDVADPDWIALVEDEVRELVRGSFLENAPIVRTSATTGEGIDALRAALEQVAAKAAPLAGTRDNAPFRMAIDRSFTLAGHGTVVTGSVSSGRLHVGDQLMIEPGEIPVRVRALHHHDREVASVHRGQRAAINLAGVHHDQVRRGHELAATGFLVPSRLVTAQVELLPSTPRPLKRRDRIRLHVGTAEVLATVVPLERDVVEPGEVALAQLFLREPVVTTWNQPFVLRAESPVVTVAGGRVLVPSAEKIRRPSAAVLDRLRDLTSDTELTRAAAAAYFAGPKGAGSADLRRIAGVADPDAVFAELQSRGEVVALPISGQRQVVVAAARLAEYAVRIESLLGRWHDLNPLQTLFDRVTLGQQFAYVGDPVVFNAVLERMAADLLIRLTPRAIGLADRGPKLTKGEQQVMRQLIEIYRAAGTQPPSVKECEQAVAKHQKAVPSLIRLAASEGELIEIGDRLYLHADVESELRRRLAEAFRQRPELTVSEIRDELGTTRKYAVPLCEFLDRIGFTERQGDLRRLSSGWEEGAGPESRNGPSGASHVWDLTPFSNPKSQL